MIVRWGAYWLPRSLHPAAWWVWALGLTVAASRTTNPLLLALILAVAGVVVVARRTDAPWALALRLYLILGAFVVVMRILYRVIFGGSGDTVLFTLPEVPLPDWAAGLRLFGEVSAEALLGGCYDGLRLATMIVCVGAANALANPKRLLRSVPSALYEVGASVVVALTVFPQLAESVLRVRRARKLRGDAARGRGAIRGILVPVLADALDRSLLLAASMDARGYGRHGAVPRRSLLVTNILMLAGLLGVCVGIYGVLDGSTPRYLGAPMLLAGIGVAGVGLMLAGRRVRRTRYRPDHWRLAETVAALAGVVAGASLYVTVRIDPMNLNPSLSPLAWPELSPIATLGVLVAVLPAWLTPRPPSSVPGLPTVPDGVDISDEAEVMGR